MNETLRQILIRHGRLSRAAQDIPDNADLFAAGLDSLAVVNVMLAIEDEFGIEIPDNYLNRASFSSIRAMAGMIRALQHDRDVA